jgi:hypothetical protein
MPSDDDVHSIMINFINFHVFVNCNLLSLDDATAVLSYIPWSSMIPMWLCHRQIPVKKKHGWWPCSVVEKHGLTVPERVDGTTHRSSAPRLLPTLMIIEHGDSSLVTAAIYSCFLAKHLGYLRPPGAEWMSWKFRLPVWSSSKAL